MATSEIRHEVERLAQASAWPGCPGGWQFPFDFGDGVVAPTYGPVQLTLHPWRREIMLDNLDTLFAGHYHQLSVLDLGACEGMMAEGLWLRGVRDITCVEARPINVEKAKFVAAAKGYDFRIVAAEIADFLAAEDKTYDLVLFTGVLNHLLDPFLVSRRIAACTRRLAVFETALAQPSAVTFDNPQGYQPTTAAFFIRVESRQSNTAGLHNLELWPTRAALELTLREAGFARAKELDYGLVPDPQFAAGQRAMYFAFKTNNIALNFDHWRQERADAQGDGPSTAPVADIFFANLLCPSADPVMVDLIGRDLSDVLNDEAQPTDTKKHAAYYMAQVHEHRGEWADMAAMLDMSGVAPGWDADRYDFLDHAGWAHVLRQGQEVAIERGIPAIHINSLWHSGSSFLAAFVTTALEIDRCRTSKGPAAHARIVPAWLATLLRGGATTHEHFAATDDNMAALDAAGASLLTVHLRHPVAAMISMYRLFAASNPEAVDDSGPDAMAAFAEVHLKYIVQFMESWRAYVSRPQRRLQVVLTRYEDMIADPAGFGHALLLRHLGDAHAIDAAAIMARMNDEARRDGAYNFKGAQSNRFVAGLDPATRDVVDRLVTPGLLQFFDYRI